MDQLLDILMQRLKTDPTLHRQTPFNAEQSLLVGQAMAQKGNKALLQHVAVTLPQQCNRLIQRHTTGRREGGMGEMEVGNRPIVGIAHHREPGVVIKLRAALPDFSRRHVVVIAEVVAIVLRPTLPDNAIVADQSGCPMLHHMARWTAKRLQESLNARARCFHRFDENKAIRVGNQHGRDCTDPAPTERRTTSTTDRTGGHQIDQLQLAWQAYIEAVIFQDRIAGRPTQSGSTFGRTKQISHGLSQSLRGEEIHQQTVVTITNHLLNRGSGGTDNREAPMVKQLQLSRRDR